MRKSKPAAHENHERWLVSYADFITLLFAFFVVMFASTQADKNKTKAVSESVREALEHGQFSNAISVVLGRGKHENSKMPVNPDRVKQSENLPPVVPPPAPPSQHPADLKKSLQTLQAGLDLELKGGKLQLKLEARGLVISMREAAFYKSGDDAVAPASFPIIAKIAEVIRDLPQPLRIEGHTDAIPIHNSRFRSNWELSSARAIAMLELLRQRYDIPPERMAVAGYAENAPTDTNETAEGRAHNRRVDLVVLSADALKSEPAPAVAQPASSPAGQQLPVASPKKSDPSNPPHLQNPQQPSTQKGPAKEP
ncbi:MAG TPA: flagellar motor protein MotB [Bryobacteraceae bacterium]|jgi:chemotaxis protein MotB|nr:flagellar motor protein MotB [Bryobacteraceae bacterium]